MSVKEPQPWHIRARCAGSHWTVVALFFPEPVTVESKSVKTRTFKKRSDGEPTKTEREYLAKIAASKEICAQCPVITECRDHADAKRLTIGTYGGETSEERRARWKRERRARAV